MALIALLFAHHGAGRYGEPPAVLVVAGVTVIERQARQARDCGATRVLVAVERMPPGLAAALDRADVEIVRTMAGFALEASDRVLVIADSLLVDTRAVAAVLEREAPALAVWKGRGAHDGAERIDPNSHWAGVALYPGLLVGETLAGLGEWDLQATLLRAAHAQGRPARVDLAAIEAPLIWRPVRNPDEAAGATRSQLAAGAAAERDWPSRWVHAPLEAALVPPLLARRVEARPLLIAAAASGVLAAAGFAVGWRWVGLVLAIVGGPLLGLAGRLAHARGGAHAPSARAVLGIEASWYLALALSFTPTHEAAAPWVTAALIVIGIWGNVAVREGYQALAVHSFDEAEDRLRRFGGHRHALLWSLLPFAVFGAWWAGFVWLAAYSAATFLLSLARLFRRLAASRPSDRP